MFKYNQFARSNKGLGVSLIISHGQTIKPFVTFMVSPFFNIAIAKYHIAIKQRQFSSSRKKK